MVLIQLRDLELKLKLVFRSLRMTLSFAVIVIMIIIMMIITTSKIDWIHHDIRMEKISRFLEQHEPHI